MFTILLVLVLWLVAGLSAAVLLGAAFAELTARTDDESSPLRRRQGANPC
jgi:hypothetical protein